MHLLNLDDFERRALPTLLEYATIPCLSPSFDETWEESGHLNRAADLLASWTSETVPSATVHVHRLDGRTPLLTATIEATAPSEGTVVIYGHLDKQPPLGDWSDGLDPFRPVRRGDCVYARGIADDGYSTFSAALAVASLVEADVAHPRIVIVIEASEESGSEDLEAYLDYLVDELGDVQLLICLDSGALSYDRLWVTTSLRGLVNAELTVSVLERGLHSGSASGAVPSSFRVLRELLERIEDATIGDVRLAPLHASIPPEVRGAAQAIAEEFGDVVADEMPILDGVQLMGDTPAERILRTTWYPALSVIGLGGAPAPAIAGNVLRPYTSAVLSMRLPPPVDPDVAFAALDEVLVTNPPSGAHVSLRATNTAQGWVAPPLAPWLSAALDRTSREQFGAPVGFTGEGGSIPFLASLGRRYPGVQFVATGTLGPDSNAHGIDEMLHLPTALRVTNAVATLLEAFTHRTEEPHEPAR